MTVMVWVGSRAGTGVMLLFSSRRVLAAKLNSLKQLLLCAYLAVLKFVILFFFNFPSLLMF